MDQPLRLSAISSSVRPDSVGRCCCRLSVVIAAIAPLIYCSPGLYAQTYGLLPQRVTSALPSGRATTDDRSDAGTAVVPVGRAVVSGDEKSNSRRFWWRRSPAQTSETAGRPPQPAAATDAKSSRSPWSRLRRAIAPPRDNDRVPTNRARASSRDNETTTLEDEVVAAVAEELARRRSRSQAHSVPEGFNNASRSSPADAELRNPAPASALPQYGGSVEAGGRAKIVNSRFPMPRPTANTASSVTSGSSAEVTRHRLYEPIRLVADEQNVDALRTPPAQTPRLADSLPASSPPPADSDPPADSAPPADSDPPADSAPPADSDPFALQQTPLPPAPGPQEIRLPINPDIGDARMDVSSRGNRVSMVVRDAPINAVLGLIAEQHDLNLVTAEDVTGTISVTLKDVSLESALNAILGINGYTWTRQNDIIVVSSLSSETMAGASAQGRELRVFNLNFLSASDADAVVQGLLSPVGQSFVIQSDPLDKLRTREQLIVEDLPPYLDRISSYLAQADCAPRQVQIEAHVLQIDLSDDTRHGVDFEALLARIDSARIGLETTGFTNPDESPAFFFGVDGTDLKVLMQAIKNTTNAKTLASPKVLVVNGQEARIQIGAQLGFLVTTTTQTSTLQDVQFLDVSVVLRVIPQISDDRRILMTVKPEVSSGDINPLTGLPEEETTEVETTVMLTDGKGMVIGGLIQESDVEDQATLPIAGDLWLVGKLFRRVRTVRSRSEIVIALVPRLVPYTPAYASQEEDRLLRATSPLVGPHLERVDRRPLEPELPDAIRNPRRFDPQRARDWFRQHGNPYPHPKTYYFPSADGDVNLHGYFPRDPEVLGGHETYFEQWPAGEPWPGGEPWPAGQTQPMYAPPPTPPHQSGDTVPQTPTGPQQ